MIELEPAMIYRLSVAGQASGDDAESNPRAGDRIRRLPRALSLRHIPDAAK
jgi:hypothetical protein